MYRDIFLFYSILCFVNRLSKFEPVPVVRAQEVFQNKTVNKRFSLLQYQ